MSLTSLYQYKPYAPPRSTVAARPTPPATTVVQPSQLPPYQRPVGPREETDQANPWNLPPVSPPGGQSAPAAPQTPGGGGGDGGYDFESDPILAKVRALNQRLIADAEASALAGRKQSEITMGFDPSLHYEDTGTENAARQNPFSALAQLLANHNQNTRAIDEGNNQRNLFYSSQRAGDVRGEAKGYTLQQSQTNQGFQKQLADIAAQLLGVKQQAMEREVQAEESAYERALAYGGGGGGSGGGGGGGGGSLENAGQFGGDAQALQAAAARYAAGKSYGGAPYVPHMVMQEGHVETRNGVPGVYIKYDTGASSSTEWTPIG